MTVIAIPKVLRDKLSDEGADAFVEILDKVEERTQKAALEISEERFEKRLAEFEAKIEHRLSDFKGDIIKWMIGVAVSQMALTLSIVSVFARR